MGTFNQLFLLVGALAASAMASGAATADDQGDRHSNNGFKGSWTCSSEHVNPPVLVQIYEMKIGKDLSVSGDLSQADARFGEFFCDIDGAGARDDQHRARIHFDLELTCLLPGFDREVTQRETSSCIGSGKTRRGKYTKMVCIDRTTRNGIAAVAPRLAHCDRQ
jgi:hypothetical protein